MQLAFIDTKVLDAAYGEFLASQRDGDLRLACDLA